MVAVRTRFSLLLSLVLLLSAVASAGVAGASAGPAKPGPQVYVVAGVLEPVDVILDGKTIQKGVPPKSVLGPFAMAAGDHTITFDSESWSARSTFTVDHPSVDVVVHRPADAAGDPIVSVFTNNVRPITADKARLTIAHTAVVPPADVRVSGEVLFANIANGEFVTAEVPAKTYSVDIVPTGETTPLLGPLDLTVKRGALNRVFAIGQPQGGSMDAIVQVIPLPTRTAGTPTSVDAGSAGLVDPATIEQQPPGTGEPSSGGLVPLLISLLGAALLVGGLSMRSRWHHVAR
jgi:hypothetical protein